MSPLNEFDFCGIGNACVDITANVDESFLQKWSFPKGICSYIQLETANALEAALVNPEYIAGGCAANVAACFSSLGGKSSFLGRVAKDAIGRIFLDDMQHWNIYYSGIPCPPEAGGSTRVFCLITPDGERTFASFYGAQEDLSEQDLDPHSITASKVLYLDGYALNAPLGGQVFLKAAALARSAGRKVAFAPNDLSILDKYADSVTAIAAISDIILCNEDEALVLSGRQNLDDALKVLKARFQTGAVTLGKDGAVIFDAGQIIRLPASPPPGPIVNTNGAGDNFAGGFLFGLTHGYPLEKCGTLGTLCAAAVLTRSCARPGENYKDFLRFANFVAGHENRA